MKTPIAAIALAASLGTVRPNPVAADQAGPATLALAGRVELGGVHVQLHYNDRWGRLAVTREGHLLVFYATADRRIVYRLSRDGRRFSEPVPVARGTGPAVALDAGDNVHLAFQNPRGRIGLKRLARTGSGKWDAGQAASEPFARFGSGPAQLPTLLIAPHSARIWCLFNYQPAVLAGATPYQRRKGRTEPVVTYSDDGGRSWAEPVFVGSDSGDVGTGTVVLRCWRGRPVWFWAFWDCAPPAWGFFDGSRFRGLREFFPHTKFRTACWHPWDAAEGPDGKLHFATGLDYQTRGQLTKRFDGSAWSPEVLLREDFGVMALLHDGRRTFCAVSEGAAKPRGRRVGLYQLHPGQPARRPAVYTAGPGRLIHRLYAFGGGRRPEGYLPLLLTEETPQPQPGGKKARFVDPRLVYLRLEVRPLDAGGAASRPSRPLVDLQKLPSPRRARYRPMPLIDPRAEPRTDPPKDRRWVRAGGRWVLVYADDNPGRLLAAPADAAGKLGKPLTLLGKPAWGRFQCAAVADGDDALAAVCAELDEVVFVRLTGIRNWGKAEPEVTRVPLAGLAGGAPARPDARHEDGWPSLCRTPEGRFLVVATRGGQLATATAGAGGKGWAALDPVPSPTPHPRPALLVAGGKPRLLVGGDDGIWCCQWLGGKWSQARQIVADAWIGHHFSAVAEGQGADLVYAPAGSYLGRRRIGHVRLDAGQWKQMPLVEEGRVARGLSLCSLGGGRLLCAYAARNERAEKPEPGKRRLDRFTYALRRKVFDGKAWPARADEIPWPAVPDHRPAKWGDLNRIKGVIYIPARQRGMFPTLPARVAPGAKAAPAAWSVPGFHCITRYWFPQDRGGLLVTAEIDLK